eukprot:COSAG02_NODE_1118_length_14469_cov_8.856228_4_plen_70_part_00
MPFVRSSVIRTEYLYSSRQKDIRIPPDLAGYELAFFFSATHCVVDLQFTLGTGMRLLQVIAGRVPIPLI